MYYTYIVICSVLGWEVWEHYHGKKYEGVPIMIEAFNNKTSAFNYVKDITKIREELNNLFNVIWGD